MIVLAIILHIETFDTIYCYAKSSYTLNSTTALPISNNVYNYGNLYTVMKTINYEESR